MSAINRQYIDVVLLCVLNVFVCFLEEKFEDAKMYNKKSLFAEGETIQLRKKGQRATKLMKTKFLHNRNLEG